MFLGRASMMKISPLIFKLEFLNKTFGVYKLMAQNNRPKWLNFQRLVKDAGADNRQKQSNIPQVPESVHPTFKDIVAYTCPGCRLKFSTGQVEPQIRQATRKGISFIECPKCGIPLKEDRVARVRDLEPLTRRAHYAALTNRPPTNEGRVPNMWIDKAIYGRLVQRLSEHIASVGITSPQMRFQRGIRSSKFPGEPHSAKGAEFSIEFIDHNNTRNRIFIQAGLTANGEFIFPKTFKTSVGQEYPLTKEAITKLTRGKLFDPVMPDMTVPPLNYRQPDPTRFREISADNRRMKKTAQPIDMGADPETAPEVVEDDEPLEMHIQEMGVTDPADIAEMKNIMRKYIDPNNPQAFAPGMSGVQQEGDNFMEGLDLGIADNRRSVKQSMLNLRKINKLSIAVKANYAEAVLDALNDGLTYDEAAAEVYKKTGLPINEAVWRQATEYLEDQAGSPEDTESALAEHLVMQAAEKLSEKFQKTAEEVKEEFDFSGLTSKEVETFVDTFVNTYNETLDKGTGPVDAQRVAHIAAYEELNSNRVKKALRDEDTLVPFTDPEPDYSLGEQTDLAEPRFDHPGGPPKKYHEMDGGISSEEARNYTNMFGKGGAQRKITKSATIRHEDNKYVVYSESGEKLGEHATKEGAEDQLQAIHIQQHGSQEKTAGYDITTTGQQALNRLQQGLPVGDFDPQALLSILGYITTTPETTASNIGNLAELVGMDPEIIRETFTNALSQGFITITAGESADETYFAENTMATKKYKQEKKGESTGVDLPPEEVGQNPINYSRYVNMVQDEIRAGNIPPTKVDMHALKDGQYTIDELKELVQTFKADSDAVMYPTAHAAKDPATIVKNAETSLLKLLAEEAMEQKKEDSEE